MDWLDLLAVQGTLKSLIQHHSSKASILWHSAFFTVQLSHPYMTTGKTIALTRWTIVGKVISLLFNVLSRLVITVRTGHETTHWFQIGKGVHQGCILSSCLFNFYAEYIMRNAGLEAQARIKIAARNINNLRYADDTTVTVENEEKLKNLLMRVKEE